MGSRQAVGDDSLGERPIGEDDRDWELLIRSALERLLERMDPVLDELHILPGFDLFPRRDLLAFVQRSSRAALELQLLENQDVVDRTSIRRGLIEGLVKAGIPLESLMHAQALLRGAVWHACVDAADQHDLPRAALARAGNLQTEYITDTTALAVSIYADVEAERRRSEQRDRDRALMTLLRGTADERSRLELARSFGLSTDCTYVAFAARSEGAAEALRDVTRGNTAIVGTVNADIAAIARSDVVGRLATDVPIGIGPPCAFLDLPRSFDVATRVLSASNGFGLSGPVRLEDLGLKLSVVEDDLVGDELTRRYLAPLDSYGDFGVLIRNTVDAFLRERFAIDKVADQLHVHRNSVYHRIARFEAITGADLSEIDDIVAVWWALSRSRCEGDPEDSADVVDRDRP